MTDKYIKASDCEKYFYEHLDDNGMIGAMNAIDEMPAADVHPIDRWTSVDEALPEKDGYYLVVKECEICESIDIAEYSDNHWHKHDKVIYWQPLPDLPEAIKG